MRPSLGAGLMPKNEAIAARGHRELIDELAQKYLRQGYPAEPEGTIRLIARLTPTKVIEKQS